MQSQFVKFRIRPDLKNRLQAVAKDSHTSVSAIVRRASLALAEGRALKPANIADFVAMRSAANELTAAVDAISADPAGAVVRMQAVPHPLAKAFRDLLPLRIRIFGTPCARRVEEQRKTQPLALLDEFQKSLIDEVAMDWHFARMSSFRSLSLDHDAPNPVELGDVGGPQRGNDGLDYTNLLHRILTLGISRAKAGASVG